MNRSVASSADARPTFAAECGAVFVGGFVGVLLRYALVSWVDTSGSWPWPIFIANILGCIVLGYVIERRTKTDGSPMQTALLGTGFCGGLTTFSTFQLEIYQLLDAHSYFTAALYLMVSITLGFAAVRTSRRYVNRGKELA